MLNRYIAISPAANLWQKNFINALISNNYKILIITYLPMQSWPKGKLWSKMSKNDIDDLGNNVFTVSFLNIPLIRDLWIPLAITLKSLKYKNYNVITYNPVFRHTFFAKISNFLNKNSWISIIADDKFKGKPTYSIFLSRGYFDSFVINNKFHFDGAIEYKISNSVYESSPKVLLYAGSITKWTGIEDFTIMFNNISNQINLELHIYGKGNSSIIQEISNRNSKIKFMGFQDENNLDQACSNAFAFINPRPLLVKNGDNNFPSKLLLYASYTKPILSTKTLGLSDEICNILNIYNPEKPQDLLMLINDISIKENYMEAIEKIKNYNQINTWENKIKVLFDNINNIK
jgi:hypothetical protein